MKKILIAVLMFAFTVPAFAGKAGQHNFWDFCKRFDNGAKWHHWWDDHGHSYNPPPVLPPVPPVVPPKPTAKPSFGINGMNVPLAQCQATKTNAPHLLMDSVYFPVSNTAVSARFAKGQVFKDKYGMFSRSPVSITLTKPLRFKVNVGTVGLVLQNISVAAGTYKFKTVKTGGYARDYGKGRWKWSVADATVSARVMLRLYSYFDAKGVFVNSRLVVITNNVTPNKRGYVFNCK
jgi:hypothetical protein